MDFDKIERIDDPLIAKGRQVIRQSEGYNTVLAVIPHGLYKEEQEYYAALFAMAPALLEIAQEALPYLAELQRDNFSEPGAGIQYDWDLDRVFEATKSVTDAFAKYESKDRVKAALAKLNPQT